MKQNQLIVHWEEIRGYFILTVVFAKVLFVLNPEEECLEDEGNDDGHHDHGENVEAHKEQSGPVRARRDGVSLHDHEPIVNDLKKRNIYVVRTNKIPSTLEPSVSPNLKSGRIPSIS